MSEASVTKDALEERVSKLEEENKCMRELISQLQNAILGGAGKATPVVASKGGGRITMKLSDSNSECVVVFGDTYPYRPTLKEHGGIWNRGMKAWTLPVGVADQVYFGLQRFAREKGFGEDVVENLVEDLL